MEEVGSRALRRSRRLVIAEAAVEYFIHLCVTTTCLTAILNEMGVAASLQGVIGAITSLACSVQAVAVFRVKRTYPCKRWVSLLNLVNQLLFALLYVVPSVEGARGLRVALLVGLLLAAYVCQHYLTPSRVNWQMALVEDNGRGAFTARKEIVSLVGGMIFSQCAGLLLDHCKEAGDMRTCFLIFAVTVTVLALLHLIILLCTEEPAPAAPVPPKSFGEILRAVFGNPDLRRVMAFDALFAVSNVSLHFYSVYLVQTLGFSYTYITAISILHACFRAAVSPFLGRLADRRSWAYMLRICMVVMAAGYGIFACASPANARYLYPVFSLCYAFSLGGSNAGRTNLCLDYVRREDRRYILGLQSAISGVLGFLATLPASALVEGMERGGNRLLGVSLYPQQLLFAVSAGMLLVLAFGFLPLLKKPTRVADAAKA